ncbi:MAG: Mut7-C RNAse domain-containing protein [Longimicrobiales bacterium]
MADAMLGRLARWLRALGRDVLYDEVLDDDALARTARGEDRLLLTRDRRLCTEQGDGDWCRIVEAQKPAAQLRELTGPLALFEPGWRDRLFTRCMVCNTSLEDAPYDDVADTLPPEVRADPRVRSAGFRRCPACGRVYWEGSHTRRMRRWLEAVAPE